MKCSVLEMEYRKNVMSTMVWTNDWISNINGKDVKNKEYLFLIEKTKKSEVVPDFKFEKIDIREVAIINRRKLNF